MEIKSKRTMENKQLKPIDFYLRAGKNIIIAIIILFLISQLYVKCENEKIANANVAALNSQVKTYKLENGQLVSSVEVLQYTKAQMKKHLDETQKQLTDKFAKVQTITKTIYKTKIDSIPIVYRDSVPCIFERKGTIFEPEYSLAYTSNQKGISITELAIPDTITMVSGTKRKWFLGKETRTFDLTHSNKFVETENVQHIEIVEKKKFWQTDLFKIGLGAIGGILITK